MRTSSWRKASDPSWRTWPTIFFDPVSRTPRAAPKSSFHYRLEFKDNYGCLGCLIFTMPAMRNLSDFYEEINHTPPATLDKSVGHFNIFNVQELYRKAQGKPPMSYNRRTYHKISLIRGRNRVEYADEVIQVEGYALLFSTPRVPYHYIPQDLDQEGFFCVFTDTFLPKNSEETGFEELPLFHSDFHPVFLLDEAQYDYLAAHFSKMDGELNSDYAFKYDLIRNYIMELV